MISISIAFGVNSKAYGDNSKGYGFKALPSEKALPTFSPTFR